MSTLEEAIAAGMDTHDARCLPHAAHVAAAVREWLADFPNEAEVDAAVLAWDACTIDDWTATLKAALVAALKERLSTDDVCVVEVGVHPGPYWVDANGHVRGPVCSRHRAHFEERAEEFGPFDWQPLDSVGTQETQ